MDTAKIFRIVHFSCAPYQIDEHNKSDEVKKV